MMTAVIFDYGVSEAIEKEFVSLSGLNDNDVQIYKVDLLVKDNNYILPKMIKRCVFVTPLPSGFMQYHYRFVKENSHITSWIFSVYDVYNEPYRKSYKEQINVMFYKKNVSYDICFDESKDFYQTQKACLLPIKEKLQLSVFSKNISLSEDVCDVLQQFIPEWNVVQARDADNTADAVVIVGENESDFDVDAPERLPSRRFVWINKAYYDFSTADREKYLLNIQQKLTENKWDLADLNDVCYCSSIWQEKLGYQYQNGEISEVGLKNNDNFVMWDEYGLPSTEYTKEKLTVFFKKNCSFHKIAYELRRTEDKNNEAQK